MKWMLGLLLLLTVPAVAASAQIEIAPTGSTYNVAFNAFSGTVEVCAFGMTAAGIGVDRGSPTGFDKADNYACTTTLTADGTTRNTISITISPLPATDVLIGLIAYPAAGSTRPISAFSNNGTLLVRLKAPVIVP